jgi:hypothetical protein
MMSRGQKKQNNDSKKAERTPGSQSRELSADRENVRSRDSVIAQIF